VQQLHHGFRTAAVWFSGSLSQRATHLGRFSEIQVDVLSRMFAGISGLEDDQVMRKCDLTRFVSSGRPMRRGMIDSNASDVIVSVGGWLELQPGQS
ncbi:hypothetical protein BaRGS_00008545, partial [Batillaria attramentaria]